MYRSCTWPGQAGMARTRTSLSKVTSPSSNSETFRLSKGRQTTTRSSSSCARHSPDQKPRRQLNFARQLLAFAVTMQTGDVVILPRKLTSQIAMGRVTGPYRFSHVNSEHRHTRRVEWLQTDIPRTTFEQDLLYSFGAFMTVCNISRNDAARRVAAVLAGKADPGPSVPTGTKAKEAPATEDQAEAVPDLVQMAHDQIVARIQSRFPGHALTRLVDAVLQVEGWVTKVSPPGPDGGVDILAGRGSLGLDGPRLCVQVKSQQKPRGRHGVPHLAGHDADLQRGARTPRLLGRV